MGNHVLSMESDPKFPEVSNISECRNGRFSGLPQCYSPSHPDKIGTVTK
jgi:hypothetical protein